MSDESAGNGASKGESRRAKRARIRNRYESSELSLREIARLEGESESTVMKWSMQDHWTQKKRLVREAVRRMEADTDEKTLAIVRDQIQPLIDAEKAKITKRGIKIGNHGLSRMQKLWRSTPPTEAKAEADGARAAETFMRMVRTSAGMNDGSPAAGSLNLNILCNQAAVQLGSG